MTLVRVDDRRIELLAWGAAPSKERATLVFLHEGLGCAAHWRDFPAKVAHATGLPAIAYSRLGYGASDPIALPRPLTYMQDEAKEMLPRVLDAANVGPVILVGQSDGASIAIVAAALDAGKRIRALVLEAPHVFVEEITVASIAKAKEAYEHGDLRARLAKYHGDNVDTAFWGWNRAWLDPDFRAWNIEEHLPRVAVPTLVVQGEDDPYGTRAQVDAIAKQAGGRVEVAMLASCGHAPHRDQEEATLGAIARFVRAIDEEASRAV
jgi:pimeloyl-ACP methyl ester carboxylesterase